MTTLSTDTTSVPEEQRGTAPAALSLPRLYLLRLGYLILVVGLALTQWPELVDHSSPWPLMEGVVTCMLVALSLVALLGLRHPVAMLPILLFEVAWKAIWVTVVALPLWLGDQLDPATAEVFTSCLVVVFVVAVIPWRYVVTRYVTSRGERWRPDAH